MLNTWYIYVHIRMVGEKTKKNPHKTHARTMMWNRFAQRSCTYYSSRIHHRTLKLSETCVCSAVERADGGGDWREETWDISLIKQVILQKKCIRQTKRVCFEEQKGRGLRQTREQKRGPKQTSRNIHLNNIFKRFFCSTTVAQPETARAHEYPRISDRIFTAVIYRRMKKRAETCLGSFECVFCFFYSSIAVFDWS